MPRRLAFKVILAVAVIFLVVQAISLSIEINVQEAQLIESMPLGADQLSRSITSATWHAMLADRRDNVYQ